MAETEARQAEAQAELVKLERKLAEAERRAAESAARAREAERARSLFLARINHEIRTPLNAVLGYASLMEGDAGLSDGQRENLAVIHRSGTRLLQIFNNLLSISRLESGRIKLVEQPFDLLRLLRKLREKFQVQAVAKNLDFWIASDADLPKIVVGDQEKLRRVLVNLLNNALKFTQAGYIALTVARADRRIVFSVADTGPGVAPEDRERILEPFVQSQTGLDLQEGLGLGLPVSRLLVKLMGGDISVGGEVGKGSVFSFEVHLPEARTPASHRDTGEVVGIVSKQPLFRLILAGRASDMLTLWYKRLSSVGFDVIEAPDGDTLIRLWADRKPHLILLDLDTPIPDMTAAMYSVRNFESGIHPRNHLGNVEAGGEPAFPHTIFLAFGSNPCEKTRRDLLVAGCDEIIVEPRDRNTVFEKLSEYLGVRFEYESRERMKSLAPPDNLTAAERFEVVPQRLRLELNRVALEGDIDGAKAVVAEIAVLDPKLAGELNAMIRDFRFEDLQELLETAEEAAGNGRRK